MGLDLFFSVGERGGSAGLPAAMLDMSVELGKGDVGVFATAAIGALVVLKGWLSVFFPYGVHYGYWLTPHQMVCPAGYRGVRRIQ